MVDALCLESDDAPTGLRARQTSPEAVPHHRAGRLPGDLRPRTPGTACCWSPTAGSREDRRAGDPPRRLRHRRGRRRPRPASLPSAADQLGGARQEPRPHRDHRVRLPASARQPGVLFPSDDTATGFRESLLADGAVDVITLNTFTTLRSRRPRRGVAPQLGASPRSPIAKGRDLAAHRPVRAPRGRDQRGHRRRPARRRRDLHALGRAVEQDGTRRRMWPESTGRRSLEPASRCRSRGRTPTGAGAGAGRRPR